MKSNTIRSAMDTINPTEAQRDRMRAALIARLPQEPADHRSYQAMPQPRRRRAWLSAAAAVVTVAVLGGVLFTRLGAGGIHLSPSNVAAPTVSGRSLEQFFASAQYRASVEWNAYLDKEKRDDTSVQALESPYPNYGCQDRKMADKLDELCKTYGLELKRGEVAVNDYNRLLEIVCIDTVCRITPDATFSFENYGSAYCADGSFSIAGQATLDNGLLGGSPIVFQLYRIMHGTFHDALLEIGDLSRDTYTEYTTQSGTELLLISRQDESLILAQQDEYVILITAYTDAAQGSVPAQDRPMDRSALEAFAELFDYTLPTDGGLAPIPAPTAVANTQLNVYSVPSESGSVIGTIAQGTQLDLTSRENINGMEWGFYSGQRNGTYDGWVRMDDVDLTYAKKNADTEQTGSIQEQDGAKAIQAYAQILDKYTAAITEHWGGERCGQEDVSIVLRDLESLDSVGYVLLDVDGNGVQELLLVRDEESQPILDLYTQTSDGILHVFSGWERNQYFLRQGGRILNIGSEGAAKTTYVFNRLSGCDLIQEQIVCFDADEDAENPWFLGFDRSPVTEAQAQEAINAYTTERLSLTPLSQLPD